MLCLQCGHANDESNRYCRYCGELLKPEELPEEERVSPKKRSTYIWLALFFGWLGVNDFYSGHTGRGIAKLLLALGGLFKGIGLVIAMIWTGIQILHETKDSRQRELKPCGNAFATFMGVLSFVFALLFIGGCFLGLYLAREAALRIRCTEELKRYYPMLKQEADKNNGRLTVVDWIESANTGFYCQPGCKTHYVLFIDRMDWDRLTPELPLMMDAYPSHRGGFNVLYGDGSVRWVKGPFNSYAEAVQRLSDDKAPPIMQRNARYLDRELPGPMALDRTLATEKTGK